MKEKLIKMMLYLDLIQQSEWKENNITESVYYKVFDTLAKQRTALKFQVKVTERLKSRLETLKKEL